MTTLLHRFNTKQIFFGIILIEAAAIFLLLNFVFSTLSGQAKSQALTDMATMTRTVAQQVDEELNKVAFTTKIISDAYMRAYEALPEQSLSQTEEWRSKMHSTETSWAFYHDGSNRPETPFQSPALTSFVDKKTHFDSDAARQIAAAEDVKYLIQGIYENYQYSWVYISTEDDLVHIYPSVSLEYSSASTAPTTKHWYLAADFENKTFGWEEPYSDLAGEGQMVTVSYPFYDQQGLLKGVTSHDIKIQQLLDAFLKDIELYDNSTIVVTSRYGKAISTNQQIYNDEIEARNKDSYRGVLYYLSPQHLIRQQQDNPESVISDFSELNQLSGSVMQRLADKGSLSFELDVVQASGQEEVYQVSAVQIPATGWTIINAVPNSAIIGTLGKVNERMQVSVAFILAFLYLAIGFIYYFRLFVPIQSVSSIATEISDDNLEHELPTQYSGEMGVLFKNFGRMIEKLRHSKELTQEYHRKLEDEVKQRTEELHEKNKLLAKIAETDPLTQLFNRHKLYESLSQQLEYAGQGHQGFTIILLDIDNFKAINDSFGHNVGDLVLKEFASILRAVCQGSEIVGRWGGEEFLIICPQSDLESTIRLAEKLRVHVEQQSFPEVGCVTASFGVSMYQVNDNAESLLERTDVALYQAKDNGRNDVCCVDHLLPGDA